MFVLLFLMFFLWVMTYSPRDKWDTVGYYALAFILLASSVFCWLVAQGKVF